jgi:hypothetical protein
MFSTNPFLKTIAALGEEDGVPAKNPPPAAQRTTPPLIEVRI